MIRSMTGYGRGERIELNRRATVEISAVNHRYFDANIRIPRVISFFEEEVRKYVKERVARGKLDIYITYHSEAKEDMTIIVNDTLCAQYVQTLRALQADYNLIDDISVATIAKLPDIMTVQKNADDTEQIWNIIHGALEDAVHNFNLMREKEGWALKEDLLQKNQTVARIMQSIHERSPFVVEEYKQKLQQRMLEALENIEIDSNRILTEVAIFADRASIDEELTRLDSHIHQLHSILGEGGVVGRKLDFLIQEMNRESNTIGSKANDQLITKSVIELKSEIEKIREQVQNIE